MSAQEYFRNIEDDCVRGDRLEAIDVIVQPRDIRSIRFGDGKTNDRLFEILPHQLTGPWLINLGKAAYNIFSMHGIPTTTIGGPLVSSYNFGFGDSFVVILDAQEFVDRFQRAANRIGFAVDANVIEYYDENTYTGDVGPFRKSYCFEYQREFRLTITPGCVEAVTLDLGSLESITSPIWPLAEINQLVEFVSRPSSG